MTKLNGLAFKKVEDFDRNKLTGHTYNCPWNNDPQYTHLWNDLEYLKTGKVARCGQPETHSCVHRVEYSIAGFRNTCPIAGRCGTYATPAPLRFSQFDFKGRDVKGKIELNTIKFSFKHKNNGVDVANGKEAKTWGGKFSKVKVVLKRYDNNKVATLDSQIIEKGPSINQYKTVAVNFNLDTIAKNISSQTQRKTFDNNRTLDLKQNNNFAIELYYYRVENTNPSVIRLKDVDVDVTFTYLDKPSINVTKDKNVINCSSKQVTHIVKVNNEEAFKNLTYKNIPTGFSKPSISVDKNNYTKTYTWKYTKALTDTKTKITYYTQANNFNINHDITIQIYQNKIEQIIKDLTDSKIVNKPISTITKFVKGSKYNSNTKYVKFNKLKKSNSLCYDEIKLRIKNPKQTEFSFRYLGNDQIYQCLDSTNHNATGLNRCFYEQIINKLQCGEAKVSVDFIVNKKVFKTVSLPSIIVTSPAYSFEAIVESRPRGSEEDLKEVDDPKHINQTSTDSGDTIYDYYVTFKRSDNYKGSTAPTVELFYNETNPDDTITAKLKNNLFYDEDEIRFKINTDSIGTFKVGFYYRDSCNKQYEAYHEFTIIPEHRQYYDCLYIDEDGIDYSYDSIVIREGDNNRVPIAITDITEINSYNNIKICFNGGKTSISEIGLGELCIQNNNDFAIKKLAIELNPLIKDEDTGEYDWANLWETIFENFVENFFLYNIGRKGLVDIVTNNNEDVYLIFSEIPPNDHIKVYIPFQSKSEGTYYMSLFINGIQLKRSTNNDFLPHLDIVCSESNYAKFIITDTMLLELKINNYDEYINIDDYHYTNADYDEDCNLNCPNNECNQCGPFTVLYSIKNIDSILPISGEDYFIRIGHSPELEPIIDFDGAYEFDTEGEPLPYPLPYAYVQVIIAPNSLYEDEEPITYTLKTDENGEGIFYYTIPSTELYSYNTKELRADKFGIFYNGNNQNNPCVEGYNNKELIIDDNKFNTYIRFDDDYSQYRAGEIVPIHFQLIYEKTPYDNGIYINLNEEPFKDDFEAGRTIVLPIRYQGVKNNPNQILETSIETISDTLTNNYISKEIYCNIDTKIKIDASLAKTLVQQNDTNTLNIVVKNGLKPNKEVRIRVCANGYNIKNINNITNGTYTISNIDKEQNNNDLLYWNIGNMSPYEKDTISIDLQAQNDACGQKNICIKAFDYLHKGDDSNE